MYQQPLFPSEKLAMGRLEHSPSNSPTRGYSSPIRSSGNMYRSQGKLEHVAERFSTFYNDLEQEKQQRRTQEATRYQQVQENLTKLERSLEAEIQRRTESDKQLQSHFSAELKSLQDKFTSQIGEMQQAFKSSLEGVSRTLQDLHIIMKEEREQRRASVEGLAHTFIGKINECVTTVDEERVARINMEDNVLKQVGHDIYTLQDRLEKEKVTRESEVAALRADLQQEFGSRGEHDEKFQASVLDEIAELKKELQVEREERVAEDDEIVQAVNDYTRALQDGLRLVNTT